MKESNLNGSSHSAAESYLSTISPQDKDWDIYKTLNNVLRELYKDTNFDALPSRLDACSGFLEFGITPPLDDGSVRLKLRSAKFCRVRHCPVCQSRRSSMWFARLINSIPLVEKDYPKARYIFLTLTLRNCRVEELKDTIKWMNKSWIKLTKKKCFPGIGYVKSTEVTRNREEGTVHPHFHILIMVEDNYFNGRNYLSQKQWTEIWKLALNVQYIPIVHVEIVKPKIKPNVTSITPDTGDLQAGLATAISETVKYSVKAYDLIGNATKDDAKFLETLTSQLHKTRAISIGGILREYISDKEPEDLIGKDETPEEQLAESHYFGWRENIKHYVRYNQ